ncbi:hypothetical protein BC826DRAFT_188913 [Russula brevipes]|nr:hypothetical protein BC826DRAFT_188913 [Russula brevipes]
MRYWEHDMTAAPSHDCRRFVRNEFTLRAGRRLVSKLPLTRIITVDDKRIKAEVWDTGRAQYRAITAACVLSFSSRTLYRGAVCSDGRRAVSCRLYRRALGALLLYDVTKLSSFSIF